MALTPTQRRELSNARDCADAGINYFNVNAQHRALLRRLVEKGYLTRDYPYYRITETGRAALDDIPLSPAQIAALEELADPAFWSAVNARRNTLESLLALGLVGKEMGMGFSSQIHDIPEYVINDAGRAALKRVQDGKEREDGAHR